jgi:phage terminase small subunit
MKLTSKQKLFCEYYVSNGFNATQAAISAGYSEKTARQIGFEILKKPDVSKYIEDYKKKVAKIVLITTEDVVRGLMKEAFGECEDSTSATRISALKALSDYTGGFDANRTTQVNVDMTHEEWLRSLD